MHGPYSLTVLKAQSPIWFSRKNWDRKTKYIRVLLFLKLFKTSCKLCIRVSSIIYTSSEWIPSIGCEVSNSIRMKTSCAIGQWRKVGYFLSALTSCPTSSFKGCYESATLPLISFPRLSPPLKIKPVSQIISQANQQSLCVWGWEGGKLAIKHSMGSLGGKKSCSRLYFSTSWCTSSTSREFLFPHKIVCYLGATRQLTTILTRGLINEHNLKIAL